MIHRRFADACLFLNALVALKTSLELRTTVFSTAALDSLLGERLAAITFSPPGALNAERLLGAYMEKDELFRPIAKSTHATRWRCYAQAAGEQDFCLKGLLDHDQLLTKVSELAKYLVDAPTDAPICVLVPEVRWTSQHDEEIRTALRQVIAYSATDALREAALVKRGARRPIPDAKSHSQISDRGAFSEREVLLRERKRMLDEVGTFTSEDLASAVGSTTSNASQFAADQRNAGKIFGVRFGQAWRYPKFQFDSKRHTLPEMKAVLSALSPDEQGWDRLQWFLEPHEALNGRTPLEVWKIDRQKVIEAARTERWNGRD